jgi:hypothetical protein
MGEFVYALSWVFDVASLDLRGKSLAALIGHTVAWGIFGLLFTIGPTATVTLPIGIGDALARGLVFLIGAGLLARIVQGWMFYCRYARVGRSPPPEMLGRT